MKLTPWIGVFDPPVRIGAYQRYHNDGCEACYQYWNGLFWGVACLNPVAAAEHNDVQSNFQNGVWRGLAEKPE